MEHSSTTWKRTEVDYLGVDISPEMVAKAEELHRGRPGCRFLTGERADRVADFAVASGIFNVKLSAANARGARMSWKRWKPSAPAAGAASPSIA